jgi:hypothetical protein
MELHYYSGIIPPTKWKYYSGKILGDHSKLKTGLLNIEIDLIDGYPVKKEQRFVIQVNILSKQMRTVKDVEEEEFKALIDGNECMVDKSSFDINKVNIHRLMMTTDN